MATGLQNKPLSKNNILQDTVKKILLIAIIFLVILVVVIEKNTKELFTTSDKRMAISTNKKIYEYGEPIVVDASSVVSY